MSNQYNFSDSDKDMDNYSYIITNLNFCFNDFQKFLSYFINCIEQYSGTITAIGIISGIIIFLYKQHKVITERRNETKEIKNAIKTTFTLILDDLKGYKHIFQMPEYKTEDDKILKFVNILFTFGGYENLRDSGNLFKLDKDTQSVLSSLYSGIKFHNDLYLYRQQHEDIFFSNSSLSQEEKMKNWPDFVKHIDKSLSQFDSEISRLTDIAIPLIETEITRKFN
jgi:hypothetical protein